MLWIDRIQKQIQKNFNQEIQRGQELIIRDEKTASGRIHVGSLRGVAIHGIMSEVLSSANISNKFLYEINDVDPMDNLPANLPESEFAPFMGQQLKHIPSPDGKAKNYAEYYADEFIRAIAALGFDPQYYRASELYDSGRMNEVIRIALENSEVIRQIYKEKSNSIKPKDWLPLSVRCEHCNKIGTTQTNSFNGSLVSYHCKPRLVTWASGCGMKGETSPYDGRATLPWKVEWAAKFVVLGVHVEGCGKDHSTKGGARDVANEIARKVYHVEPPLDIPYEFFLIDGRKMSSSKAVGASAIEIAEQLPRKILRLLLLGKDIKRQIDFQPHGNSLPLLYDWYDTLAKKYWSRIGDDDARLFQLIHKKKELREESYFLPRFIHIAYLIQMPHLNFDEEVSRIKGSSLGDVEKLELNERAKYARLWLDTYAPEEFKFTIQEKIPESASELSREQKKFLKSLLEYIMEHTEIDGQEFHTKLHEMKEELAIDPRELFESIYIILLGKKSGPKAGWFLSVIGRDFLIKRIKEAL